eukprot:gene16523-5052_t
MADGRIGLGSCHDGAQVRATGCDCSWQPLTKALKLLWSGKGLTVPYIAIHCHTVSYGAIRWPRDNGVRLNNRPSNSYAAGGTTKTKDRASTPITPKLDEDIREDVLHELRNTNT